MLSFGLRWVVAIAIFFIAGCASTTRAIDPNVPQAARWQGRLALTVHDSPPQAFSADFDLRGDQQVGSLVFFSPLLGTTMARLQWDALGAQLQTTGEARHFASLDALTQNLTGASLPIASLFAWLMGQEPDTPGWQVDLRELSSGRLGARRLEPATPAELKIILER